MGKRGPMPKNKLPAAKPDVPMSMSTKSSKEALAQEQMSSLKKVCK